MRKLLIANRGEVAVRIARAARDLGIPVVAVHSTDDAGSPHLRGASEALALGAAGPAAYLDVDRILAAARSAGCDAVHPGYGFLSERADFARACAAAGLTFVGPTPEQLERFGDKVRARALAAECRVPLLAGTGAVGLEEARAFVASLGPGAAVAVKALAGGGGRGLRLVREPGELEAAWARCRSEALAAFGDGALYVERWLDRARHVEIQLLGDGREVVELGERECSLQRRHQKLVEIAPSPTLDPRDRERLVEAALRMARAVGYTSLGTFEFLLAETAVPGGESGLAFLEVNPRLQVEHTVTEEVTGIDLVQAQLAVAAGRTLGELGLLDPAARRPRGHAIQLRINAEVPDERGGVRPSAGRLERFRPPSGPGIRVDTAAFPGHAPAPAFDSLLAKLVVRSPSASWGDAVRRARRALEEFEIAGLETNLEFLAELVSRPELAENRVHTTFIEENAASLVAGMRARQAAAGAPASPEAAEPEPADGEGLLVRAPMAGRLVAIDAAIEDRVGRGQQVAVLEAMKMEHLVLAPGPGRVVELLAAPGATVAAGQPLLRLEHAEVEAWVAEAEQRADPDHLRADLQAVRERHAHGLDERRPEAVARRRAKGQRTARENVADLCDRGSFVEYGALAIAAQRRRRPVEELIRATPADGLVAGIGTVNAEAIGPERARCLVLAYDYTVLAGTQGMMNHKKTDRMLGLAERWRLPVVLFAEGGGGRPGDTDHSSVTALDVPTFARYAGLSGLVPRVGVVAGHCFAGNAALLGCSDVIIATRNSSIGMSGPAMIEGAGLGRHAPEAIGPIDVQARNGVVDVAVADEAEAVAVAKRYLGYFQGPLPRWSAGDPRALRGLVPENRKRGYDVRKVLAALFDEGSVLELRAAYGVGLITALARVEGRPVGVLANDPRHLGGAIDAEGGEKASRFMQLCDAFGLPIVSLCDTPGFMVGPEVERQAQVRRVSRMFVTAASLKVPFFAVVLRKGYGLGAQAMAGGGFHAPFFAVAWPTGEFGAMGIEGAVRLGYRKELEAIADPAAREAAFRERVAREYEKGNALNVASVLEIDGVIDPADTRGWILRGLLALPPEPAGGRRRAFIDTW